MQFVYLQCQNTANPSKCIDCRRMFNGCAVVIVMNSMKKKKKKTTATATATATTIDTKKINSTKQKCTVCCAPTNFRCNTYTCSFSSMQTSHHEPCTQPFGHSIQKNYIVSVISAHRRWAKKRQSASHICNNTTI